MKRFLCILLVVFLFAFGINSVNAMTVNELIIELENSNLVKSLNANDTRVKITDDSINKQIIIILDDIQRIVFNYNEEFLMYSYTGDRENLDATDVGNFNTDALFIINVFTILAKASGYSVEEIMSISNLEDFIYEKNGVEATKFIYNFSMIEGVSSPSEGSAYDKVKFNLNKINLNLETENNPSNDEMDSFKDSDTTIDNPKTGVFNPIVICSILVISSILLISIINRKNTIRKI